MREEDGRLFPATAGERPTDPLTVVVAPFEHAGRTGLTAPVDGRVELRR